MAPIRPKFKAGKAVKPRAATATVTSAPSSNTNLTFPNDDPFKTTKSDKRRIKHAAFVSKIEKASAKTKQRKRRRPSKKLIANLEELANALPDAGEEGSGQGATAGHDGKGAEGIASQVNVIRQKSLKHRPGALKKKEKLDRIERERFAKNMAQLTGGINHQPGQGQDQNQASESASGVEGAAGAQSGAATSARWAALRSFISQTIDQNPQFKKPA
ncbi:hypothetical protein VTO42DRAFT_7600 [Malbranchea cinnamomea]